MKSHLIRVFVVLFCLITTTNFAQISDFIHVDQFGYLLNADKIAVISNPQVGYNSNESYIAGPTFELRDFNNDTIVYSGAIDQWNNGNTHSSSGDQGWWFDFSDFNIPGNYYVYDPSTANRSASFSINGSHLVLNSLQ